MQPKKSSLNLRRRCDDGTGCVVVAVVSNSDESEVRVLMMRINSTRRGRETTLLYKRGPRRSDTCRPIVRSLSSIQLSFAYQEQAIARLLHRS